MRLSRRGFLGWGALTIGLGTGARTQTPAEPDLQIGTIGIGKRGFDLFKRLVRTPGVAISTVADVWGPNLDKIGSLPGVDPTRTPHYGKVLFNSDAVLLAVPDHLHGSICRMAVNYQRDVYLETPVTHSIEEGSALAAAAAKTKCILWPGHQEVMNPINPKVRELLQAGEIGQIKSITGEVHIEGPTRVGYSPLPPNTYLDDTRWRLFLGEVPERPYDPKRLFQWGLYWDYSCGLAGSELVPLVATIHTLTGAEAPTKVTAQGGNDRWKELTDMPDHLSAVVEYPQGFVANLSVSCTGKNEDGVLVITGSKGKIEYKPNWCRVHPGSGDPVEFTAEGDPTTLHVAAFIKAIRTRTPAVDLAFGINAANVGHLINLSYKSGKTVAWDKATGKPIV